MKREPTLYRPEYEHDACGVGFVADIAGRPSYSILEKALQSVVNLTHRGAVSADARTGDGAGVLTQVPTGLFQRELAKLGQTALAQGDLGVGMIFLPHTSQEAAQAAIQAVEAAVRHQSLTLLGWRQVPVNASILGAQARAAMPDIRQVLVARPETMPEEEFPRALYLARKEAESWAMKNGLDDFYVSSFSHRTLVYKGLLVATGLRDFYLDLQDPDFHTALAVLHQRYSTNTFPNWVLAQPFRFLAHNGEINTLQGNRNWMAAREPELQSNLWGDRIHLIKPIIQAGGSDSCSLDNVLEALVLSGRDVIHSMMMLVPEAWENMPHMDSQWSAFYQHHATITEPWDGPAALAFSDGTVVAAALDRNGLRPARYKITDDGLVIMASEVGVIDIDDAHVVEKGRLGPGQMIAVDTARKRLLHNRDIKSEWSARQPYGSWVESSLLPLKAYMEQVNGLTTVAGTPDMALQQAFGYTSEELNLVLLPMIAEAKEPVGSMGDDTPLAILATKPRLLYLYFKQRFAQVTNPAIDSLRENLVMSLYTYLGPRHSLLDDTSDHSRLLQLESPVLNDAGLSALKGVTTPPFRSQVLECLFPVSQGPDGLEPALERVCLRASQAVDEGVSILILSDRGVDAERAPIPMLLVVGAVHHHLLRQGKRMRASIVAETGEAREMHQVACLLGYGASAVNPYLALATVSGLVAEGHVAEGLANYGKVMDKQILKIMSKMGISAVSAYHGAQIFECIGLSQVVVDRCFTGTPSSVGGIGFAEIAAEALHRHATAFEQESKPKLADYGYYRFRKDGETHAFSPALVRMVHKAVASDNYQGYKAYSETANHQDPISLRALLDFKPGDPIPIEEVEPAEEIVKRFETGSMSLGALSPEAHETLAMAMNALGAKANTGEGGEDPRHYHTRVNGYDPNCAAKQVASGRFGVTPEYLASCTQIQIKMAQGSKPGEGGQLPGHKVVEHIARIRLTQPGVPLISPAPHHDIYSIEDLAQLIYDLKMANPRAAVSVKLVSEAGVGTIAAGVVKGYADAILISGHDGGTGASPLSSIKNAGTPWELGLAETQQVLVMNDLRGRVRLQTDGGLRTGRDVVIAAMLGAEEFGFGTIAMVAIGCQMARQCHLNTCPVGVATQREDLRKKFTGTPEQAIRFFFYIAQEVREILASLGFCKLEDVIGRPELLQQVGIPDHPKANTLDLAAILAQVDPAGTRPRFCQQERNDRPDDVPLDDCIIQDARGALEGNASVELSYPVLNVHRTVGGKLAGEVAHRYDDSGLPEGVTITIRLQGSAGQSFGAWNLGGITLILTGEANDYVGKGMHGGRLVLRPPENAAFSTHENVIMGNTVLYGATGGYLFAAGRAGERFAIRNSGAWAVVEGTGDHCCEYMTGGCVVVLGETGRNLGAGMSGGVAFVLDEADDFDTRFNPEMVGIARVSAAEDEEILRSMVQQHLDLTGSPRARDILDHWDDYLPHFWKVAPHPTVAPPEPREVQRARRDAMLASVRAAHGKSNI